ncbi:ATPase, F1 complex, gamma subunit [Corchorus olitorius]|uniref:ATPase, F1 complex, gamma subunit n=1 Tax=Corchorus olitorius TaxID=93759 RepID=A0A1R3KHW4_9ROSI|nr:ATPase, F1 complex, gamma subunit [Corchorus olitorius]
MDCSNLPTWIASKPPNSNKNPLFSQFNQNPFLQFPPSRTLSRCPSRFAPIQSSLRQLRERIQTVKNTQKITEAMKLVAAAKVRRAQEAVINVELKRNLSIVYNRERQAKITSEILEIVAGAEALT